MSAWDISFAEWNIVMSDEMNHSFDIVLSEWNIVMGEWVWSTNNWMNYCEYNTVIANFLRLSQTYCKLLTFFYNSMLFLSEA